jgi:hypothetical protein
VSASLSVGELGRPCRFRAVWTGSQQVAAPILVLFFLTCSERAAEEKIDGGAEVGILSPENRAGQGAPIDEAGGG